MNFSGESDNWKVTYTFNDSVEGASETLGTIEYLGEEPMPEEVRFQFIYGNDEASFGGSRRLEEDGGYADIVTEDCKACIMPEEDDEIPGVLEWNGKKESLLLTSD